jgi:hypothetical protein
VIFDRRSLNLKSVKISFAIQRRRGSWAMHDVAYPQLGECNRQGEEGWPSLGASCKCTVDLPAGIPSLTTPSSLDRPPRPSKIVSPGCRPKRAFPGVKAGCPPSRRQVAADPHGPTAERTMTRQEGYGVLNLRDPCAVPAAVKDAARRLRRCPTAILDRHCARRSPSVQADGKIGLRPNKETVDPETVNSGKVGRAPS